MQATEASPIMAVVLEPSGRKEREEKDANYVDEMDIVRVGMQILFTLNR